MSAICFVTDEIFPATKGGIGRLVFETAKALLTSGHTIHFLLATTSREAHRFRGVAREQLPGSVVFCVDDLLAEIDPVEDIPLWAFHFLPYFQSYRIALALRKLVGQHAYDVIEFADHRGPGYVTLKWRRLWGEPFATARIVVRLHGTYELWVKADRAENHSRQELHTFRMERYCLKHADGWLSPSTGVANWYREAYGVTEKRVAVSTPAFQQIGPGRSHPRRIQRPLEVLFYGKLQHLKGPDVFIRAALKVCAEVPEPVRFHLVGHDVRDLLGPSYRARLEAAIPAHWRDRFVFHGRITPEQLPTLAGRCVAAVIPSRVETFCLAAHELNWIGVPLVLRDLPAFRDFFHDGLDCRTFGDNASDGAEALARVLSEILRAEDPFSGWTWNAPAVLASQRLTAAYDEVLRWQVALDPNRGSTAAPTVSVIVPYFNAQATLDATLSSVLASTHAAHEVIVVDDGSTQPEAVAHFDAVRARFGEDRRFRFVNKPNGGLSSARNAGLALATGTYVLPLDADDLIAPEYLALAVTALERNPELAAVSCYVSYFADGRDPVDAIDYVIAYDLDPLLITLENRAGVAGSVFRRSALPKGGYAEELPAYEDWDLWWALAEAAAEAEVMPRMLYRYRRRADGLYAQVGRSQHVELIARIEARHPVLLTRVQNDRQPALIRLSTESGRLFKIRRRLRDLYLRLSS